MLVKWLPMKAQSGLAQSRQGLQFMHTARMKVNISQTKTKNVAPPISLLRMYMFACVVLPVDAQLSLSIGTDSPGLAVYAYIKCEGIYKSDQNEMSSFIE